VQLRAAVALAGETISRDVLETGASRAARLRGLRPADAITTCAEQLVGSPELALVE
jgi:hypothetical protein